MKNTKILIFLIICLTPLVSFKKALTFEPVVVLELFTSQGCSSCPPADRLLSKTISNAEANGKKIVALSFHVDYWNYLGWKDPFSSKQFSQYQGEYVNHFNLRSSYTPQIVVNGTREFVGSDEKALEKAIKESLALESEVKFKNLNALFNDKKELKVTYELVGNCDKCTIHFALVSLSETTSIKRGENAGLNLTGHNIVKQFISIKATEKGEVKFETNPLPTIGNRAIIAYLQNTYSFKIIGAAQLKLN